MKDWIAGHRALLGLLGLAALIGLFGSLALAATSAIAEVALLLVALAGLAALVGSPYWKIVYKESPLRRAVTGITDLDERELELRDRANGLAYFLFATVNIVLLALAPPLLRLNQVALDIHALQLALVPYALFATALPVILLEAFEPSASAGRDPLDEEEEA
jgi:hypothetical protein